MLGTAAAMQCAPALAQTDTTDVIVMRRVVAPPKVIRGTGDYKAPDGTDTSRPYWAVTPWFLGEPACTDAATSTRGVACFNGSSQVADAQCSGTRPETSRTTADYRKCDYDWVSSVAGEWAETCRTTTRPLSSVCTRRTTGEAVGDDFCRGEKPVSETGFNEAGCTFQWSPGEWKDWDAACSDDTSRTRDVTCLRSDGTQVADSSCTGERPATTERGANHAGCTYTWNPGEWRPVVAGCGPDVDLVRTPTCRASDGASDDESRCDPATKPETTSRGKDYSGCTFHWRTGDWGEWSSQCSVSSTRSRTVTCMRSDETIADGKNCTEVKSPEQETVENVSGCTFDWRYSDWTPNAGCSANTSQTRVATCRRSDGSTADDDRCQGAKEETTRTFGVYSSCQYEWRAGTYTFDSACSNAANGIRAVTCIRKDGLDTPVDDGLCDGSMRPPATTVEPKDDGCAVSWAYGEWSPWSSTCSTAANRTRDASCYKAFPDPKGPTAVDQTSCGGVAKEATSETAANYSACTPYWEYGPWGWNGTAGAKSSTCSVSPQQNRTATCVKLDTTGTRQTVASAQCAGQTAETIQNANADYSGCTYDWNIPATDTTTGWGPWSATCSPAATRTRTITCNRSDGSVAPSESLCTQAKPATSQGPTAQFTGCANLLADGGFESGSLASGYTLNRVWRPYIISGNVFISNDAYSGGYSARVTYNSSTYYGLAQYFTYPAKAAYVLTFMCKGNAQLEIGLPVPGSSATQLRTVTCGSNWTSVSVNVVFSDAEWPNGSYPVAGGGGAGLYMSPKTVGSTVYIDDVYLYRY